MPAKRISGPAIFAVDPWSPGNPREGVPHQLLSEEGRAQLASIASIVRFGKGDVIYKEGDVADTVFNIVTGLVTAYRVLASGEYVISFLHQGDLFGLSEEGQYSNSVRAATSVIAYKMPLGALRRVLDANPELDVDVIVKLCEGLRESQRHALLLTQKRATTRLAIFLEVQERRQNGIGESAHEIYLPMDRSSIAAYIGLTLAALGRAFRVLMANGVISCRNRHHVRVLDRSAFNKLIDLASTEVTKSAQR